MGSLRSLSLIGDPPAAQTHRTYLSTWVGKLRPALPSGGLHESRTPLPSRHVTHGLQREMDASFWPSPVYRHPPSHPLGLAIIALKERWTCGQDISARPYHLFQHEAQSWWKVLYLCSATLDTPASVCPSASWGAVSKPTTFFTGPPRSSHSCTKYPAVAALNSD